MSEKSFAERARELQANQEKAASKQQAIENTARERQHRIDTEGTAMAQQLAIHLIADIKAQVAEVAPNGLFRLPESPQLGSALEIIAADKWLLTGQPNGSDFVVGTRELRWLNNPRARQYAHEQEEPEYVTYRIDLDSDDAWGWKEVEDTALRGVFMPTLMPSAPLTNAELAERILSKVLSLAERKPKGEGGGAGGFYFA